MSLNVSGLLKNQYRKIGSDMFETRLNFFKIIFEIFESKC